MARRRESGRSVRAWRVRRPLSRAFGGDGGRQVDGAPQGVCSVHVHGHARLTVQVPRAGRFEGSRPV
jgi:hypothetical protein